MEYTDIITLPQAKNYLKIDDTLSQDDNLITRMIKASLQRVEVLTNVHLIDKEKTYVSDRGCVNVYDFPINSVTSPTDAEEKVKAIYSVFSTKGDDEEFTLNVGYSDADDIPSDLIDVAYELLDLMYYGKDDKLSMISQSTISNYKRFWM